jgi:TM2 domain-containing membrane protein YozV
MYYLSIAGKTLGPYDRESILSGLREGRFPTDAMVCPVGSQQWLPLSAVPEFAEALPAPPPPPNPYPAPSPPYGQPSPPYGQPSHPYGQPSHPYAPPYGQPYGPPMARPPYQPPPPGYSSNRVAAGVCGILLGSLGIHKFILGMQQSGLVMLLVTICTCFIAAPVMWIIGLIEGITYLTKSDEEFYQIYVIQRKEWF